MTKRQDLYLQRRSRPEQSDQRQANQAANISHQPRASPNSTALTSRIEFPTMTGRTQRTRWVAYEGRFPKFPMFSNKWTINLCSNDRRLFRRSSSRRFSADGAYWRSRYLAIHDATREQPDRHRHIGKLLILKHAASSGPIASRAPADRLALRICVPVSPSKSPQCDQTIWLALYSAHLELFALSLH